MYWSFGTWGLQNADQYSGHLVLMGYTVPSALRQVELHHMYLKAGYSYFGPSRASEYQPDEKIRISFQRDFVVYCEDYALSHIIK